MIHACLGSVEANFLLLFKPTRAYVFRPIHICVSDCVCRRKYLLKVRSIVILKPTCRENCNRAHSELINGKRGAHATILSATTSFWYKDQNTPRGEGRSDLKVETCQTRQQCLKVLR